MVLCRRAVVLLTPLLAACAADADEQPREAAERPSNEVRVPVVPGCCGGHASEPAINGLRLSISAGVGVVDGSGTNIRAMWYKSSTIALYDGSAWISRSADPKPSVAVPTTLNAEFDIYAYWDGSGVKLELAPWASPKTFQDGVYVRSGDVSRRYLGSVGTGNFGSVQDEPEARLIWNQDNRVPRAVSVTKPVAWTLTGNNAWRELGGNW